ncbi:Hypothetical predicted protein, partial [Olea europaea subsp. europaea]
AIRRRDVLHDLNNDQLIGRKGSSTIGPRPSLSRITYEKGNNTQEMLSFFGAM